MSKNVFSFIATALLVFANSFVAFSAENVTNITLQQIYSREYLDKNLPEDNSWVPFPDYSDRAGWEKLLGDDKEKKIKAAEALLSYQWKIVKATDYLEYFRTGNREIMQVPYNANIMALEALMWGELAEGKGRFIDQVINGTFVLCEMSTWSLSASLSTYQKFTKLPDVTQDNIELWSGRVGGMLSWCNYFFRKEFNKVSPTVSKRIEYEITKRILEPYLKVDYFGWMGFTKPAVNNWNPWINGNVLQCFLLVESNKQRRAEGIFKSVRSLDFFVQGYPADGAIDEGPTYWNRAAGAMFEYIELLNTATRNTANEWITPKTKNMLSYLLDAYIGNGWVVNYNDAGAKLSTNPALVFRYAKAVGNQNIMSFAVNINKNTTARPDNFGDFLREMMDYKTKPEMDKTSDKFVKNQVAWYPDAQHAFMNNGRISVAIKASHNGESHNHNDVGHFILSVDNEPLLIDLGQAIYKGSAAGSNVERFNIRSKYHNVPIINGKEQALGKDATATEVNFDIKEQTFSANLAKAYPESAGVLEWKRTAKLNKNEAFFVEEYKLSEYKDISSLNYLTRGEVKIMNNNDVFFVLDNKRIKLEFDKSKLEPTIETLAIPDTRIAGLWGKEVTLLSMKIKSQVLSDKLQLKFSIK